MIPDAAFWTVAVGLGVGSFLIRFSFLGLLGGRELPRWILRHLKYVGAAVFPAIAAPYVLWPEATGGTPDPARMLAVGAALIAGLRGSVLAAIIAGMATLYVAQVLASRF